MSKDLDWGSKELPFVVKSGEIARINYSFFQTGPLYFLIRFKSGQLSELIEYSSPPRKNSYDSISARCACCGEKVTALIFFF